MSKCKVVTSVILWPGPVTVTLRDASSLKTCFSIITRKRSLSFVSDKKMCQGQSQKVLSFRPKNVSIYLPCLPFIIIDLARRGEVLSPTRRVHVSTR